MSDAPARVGNAAVILEAAVVRLAERGVPNARLDAELLLAEALGLSRTELLLRREEPLTEAAAGRFRELLGRRAKREPLPYIVGRQEFWSLEFAVDRHVLIPRPETELAVEAALEAAPRLGPWPTVVDMGSGCGTIAVVLAREMPRARVVAVDISREAVARTLAAAAKHGVGERVRGVAADLFTAFGKEFAADMVVSNPPYVDSAVIDDLEPEVSRFEPRLALDGGAGGLEVIARLLPGSARHLRPGGLLVFEAGFDQEEGIRRLAAGTGCWRGHTVLRDLAGHPRVHVLVRR